MKLNKKHLMWSIITLILGALIVFNPAKEMVEKPVTTKILHKVTSMSGGKHSSTNFILVLEDEEARKFDIKVSPTTYTVNNVGDIVTFNLSENDITNGKKGNLLFAIGLTALIASVVLFIISTIYETEL